MDCPDPVDRLQDYGDCREMHGWPDYLKLGLTHEHIPELLRMYHIGNILAHQSKNNQIRFFLKYIKINHLRFVDSIQNIYNNFQYIYLRSLYLLYLSLLF